jgi:Protein of unknown function (DUF3300)
MRRVMRTENIPTSNFSSRIPTVLLALAGMLVAWPHSLTALQDAQSAEAPQYTQKPPEELQQLVAPIALYPDSLVSQILNASTFPEQVVEADRWVQAHPELKDDALGQAVDPQPWDPSVKALTPFPSVLGNMDKNLSWTSSLGDAYYNQPAEVMDAIQFMRRQAQQAGNLKTTQQQSVTALGSDITIAPVDPDLVYVPAYDPWLIYGYPVAEWPGWYPYPGIWYDGPYLSFGVGFGIGWFGGFGWDWHLWGCDWHDRVVIFNHNAYYSRSNTFFNRSSYYRGGAAGGRATGGRSEAYYGAGSTLRTFNGDPRAIRGYAEPRGQAGVRSNTFSGYEHGGQERSFSARGDASFGGGARAHGSARGHR